MNNLSSSERSFLRSQAHHLEPIVLIGKNGVTGGTINIIDKALDSRELIKIKDDHGGCVTLTASEARLIPQALKDLKITD